MPNNYKYITVYEYFKKLIEAGSLKPGDKLPSLLVCANELSVSKTTVESGYYHLAADGYIISREKSGYYVSNRSHSPILKDSSKEQKIDDSEYKFDLSRLGDDPSSFRFDLWQRYVKSALRHKERMATYGEPQGELDLRQAICDYVRKNRNIYCSPDSVVIGASTQNLLMVLLSILSDSGYKTASVPARGFEKYAEAFALHGLDVNIRHKESDIIYITPSYMTLWGDVMPVKRRYEIIEHIKNGHLVIEDDYQNEFVYSKKVKPSIYALSGGENVVYMGSFSKQLLPSIRISFMILPKNITDNAQRVLKLYDQTASKSEQIALCSFIRDEHIYRQTKKLRKLYQTKRYLLSCILEVLIKGTDDLQILSGESGTEMCVEGPEKAISKLKYKLENLGVKYIEVDSAPESTTLLFSCGVIDIEELKEFGEKVYRTYPASPACDNIYNE